LRLLRPNHRLRGTTFGRPHGSCHDLRGLFAADRQIDLIDYLGDTNMTREEFDQYFAATQDTTEGFTDGQLDALNDDVWEEIRMLEMDEEVTAEHAKTVMNRIMNSWPHDGSVRT
jgi:hypothetical protein